MTDKYQKHIKLEHRSWQVEGSLTNYGYGECPLCGGTGELRGDYADDKGRVMTEFKCQDCSAEYAYQDASAWRFAGMSEE